VNREDVMTVLIEAEALLADGLAAGLIGYGERCGQPTIAVYDSALCVEALADTMAVGEPELPRSELLAMAAEYFEFNTLGAWVGDKTPIWVTRCPASNLDVVAEAITDDLLTTAFGVPGVRLAVKDANEADLGGWGRSSVKARVLCKLQELL